MDAAARACKVYCYGALLTAVQLGNIFEDSKTFVDMPMRQDPEVILHEFAKLRMPNRTALLEFVDNNFLEAGSDLEDWSPPDWTPTPSFLRALLRSGDGNGDGYAKYYEWARFLNKMWHQLGRQLSPDVFANPQRHSHLPRAGQQPLVVPGGRFRESYYWDSYWIVRGLVVCEMQETALEITNGLLDQIEAFGFVPNGGRIYYLDRSQPPLLSEMVMLLVEHLTTVTAHVPLKPPPVESVESVSRQRRAAAAALIQRALPLLEKEYTFWMDESRGHAIRISVPTARQQTAQTAETVTLNRYYSAQNRPRPESFREDANAAATAATAATAAKKTYDGELFLDIRAGAESGWDFSSRFMKLSSETACSSSLSSAPMGMDSEHREHSIQSNSSSRSSSGSSTHDGAVIGHEGVKGAKGDSCPLFPMATLENYEKLSETLGPKAFSTSGLRTREIIPVELNAVMLRFEDNMRQLHAIASSSHLWVSHTEPTPQEQEQQQEQQQNQKQQQEQQQNQKQHHQEQVETWTRRHAERAAAMNSLLFDAPTQRWLDYDIKLHQHVRLCAVAAGTEGGQSQSDQGREDGERGGATATATGTATEASGQCAHWHASISSWIPLWAGLVPPSTSSQQPTSSSTTSTTSSSSSNSPSTKEGESLGRGVVTSLLQSGLVRDGGLLTTTVASGQQWDAPNAWAPLQQLLIEGLENLGAGSGAGAGVTEQSRQSRQSASSYPSTTRSKVASAFGTVEQHSTTQREQQRLATHLATQLTTDWLESNWVAWKSTGNMFEKYNGFVPGQGGGGGEYEPQTGFGWSNGVALSLLAAGAK